MCSVVRLAGEQADDRASNECYVCEDRGIRQTPQFLLYSIDTQNNLFPTFYRLNMIWTSLGKFRDLGVLLLRALFGLYLAFGHGLGKITGGTEQWAELGGTMELLGIGFLPTFWGFMAAFAEFVCALLVVAGVATRPAALLVVINMLVAANMHIQTGNGSPESALLYGIVFLSLLFIGPGKYSVDEQMG